MSEEIFSRLNSAIRKSPVPMYWGGHESALPVSFILGSIYTAKASWCNVMQRCEYQLLPRFLPPFEGYSLNSRSNIVKLISKPTVVQVGDKFRAVRVIVILVFGGGDDRCYILLSKITGSEGEYCSKDEAEKKAFSEIIIRDLLPFGINEDGEFYPVGSLTKATR